MLGNPELSINDKKILSCIVAHWYTSELLPCSEAITLNYKL